MTEHTEQHAADNATQVGSVGRDANIYNFYYHYYIGLSLAQQPSTAAKSSREKVYVWKGGRPYVKATVGDIAGGLVFGAIVGSIIGLIGGVIVETDIVIAVTRWVILGAGLGTTLGIASGILNLPYAIRETIVLKAIRSIRNGDGLAVTFRRSLEAILQTPFRDLKQVILGNKYDISLWIIVRGTIFGPHYITYYGELIRENGERLGPYLNIYSSIYGTIARGVMHGAFVGVTVSWVIIGAISVKLNLAPTIASGAAVGAFVGLIVGILGWKILKKLSFRTIITGGCRY